jgi:diguanylate cyclase (GGDEF)-like protein
MKKTLSKKFNYILIIVVVIIMLGVNLLILLDYKDSHDQYLEYQEVSFENSVTDIFQTYEQFSKFIFESQVNTSEVKNLLFQAYQANDTEKDILRQELTNMYSAMYINITHYNFRQLHFHFPNGDSFLRMHSLDKYGDNLFDIRESVRIANEERRFVSGFEEGRIYNGYRYVYPLNLDGEHVGSVEVSISVESVIEELYKNSEDHYVFFVISKDVVEQKVFDDSKDNYKESFISDKYYEDKALSAITDNRRDTIYEEVEFVEKLKSIVSPILRESNESFSEEMGNGDRIYLVQFSAIPNVAGENVGYFVSIAPNDQLAIMNTVNRRWILFSVGTMIITVFLMLFLLRKQNEVEELAMIDQLTKIYNRRYFFDAAEKEIRKSIRHQAPLCIAMIDIDHFKVVNDTYGHPEGDQILKRLALLVSETIRKEDIFARYGGEEFVLLMPYTNVMKAEVVAERVRKAVEQYEFNVIGKITVSIGICKVDVKKTLIENVDIADDALYQAKNKGRNQVQFNY